MLSTKLFLMRSVMTTAYFAAAGSKIYMPPYIFSLYVTILNFLFFLINLFNVTKSFSNPWVRPAIFKKLSQRAGSPALWKIAARSAQAKKFVVLILLI